ncbi:MAG TPA: single-stranded-DNA-specific exonuclease RecJ [Ruminococcaceae bacterium]|nr:single-stranded-DNA-specific exonuclease RecJ [Oscillospiraceae bacterium]
MVYYKNHPDRLGGGKMKKWVLKKEDRKNAEELVRKYGLNPLLAAVLSARGFFDEESLKAFFSLEPALSDPYLIRDMDKAVERIRRAVEEGERICVYGDYDADGVTSTSILYRYLTAVGADVGYYIPERETEGYGMNREAVEKIASEGTQLIVTVDNGISAAPEIDYAKTLGMDTVVTDHHTPPERLPDAVAVVNPHRKDDTSPFHDYAGVGVVFKLLCALEDGDCDVMLDQFSDLAAIGTVADVVPLTGENRAIVKAGLHRIPSTDNLGLYSLLEVCGLADKEVTGESVAFVLAPKINAAGRVGSVQEAVRLMTGEDEEEVMRLAGNIAALNTKRKDLEEIILSDVGDQIAHHPHLVNERVIVLSGHGWHKGVIGIVSARVAETYGKPTLMIAIDEDGNASGSARSNDDFSIIEAIRACAEPLERFGGHAKAAGFSLKAENIARFTELLLSYAHEHFEEMPPYTLTVDKVVSPSEMTVENIRELEKMEPFGEENPRPVFAVCGATVEEIVPLSQGKHTRLRLKKDGQSFAVLCFGMPTSQSGCRCGETVDVCFTAQLNEYNGATQVSLKLKEMKPTQVRQDTFFRSCGKYDRLICGEKTAAREEIPTRNDLAAVYRFLRQNGGFGGTALQLYTVLAGQMSYCKMMLALEILKSEKLITAALHCRHFGIALLPAAQKIDLEASELLNRLKSQTI